ncbi:hypothetical protein ACLMJK_005176 [Lecanora helva]
MLFKSACFVLYLSANALAVPATLQRRIDHTGHATFYEQNGAAGSCGQYNSDSSQIIALSPYWNVASYCGRKIKITNNGGGQNNNGAGKTVVATVEDTCPGCGENDLDLSHGAFQALTGGNLDPPGEFSITW